MKKQNTRAKEYRGGAEESDMHIDLEMRQLIIDMK
jgi:hypothetical protein